MNLIQILSKLPIITKFLKINEEFVEVKLVPNKDNITLKINRYHQHNWKDFLEFQLEEKPDNSIPTETLEQFKLKKTQAEDRLKRMEQGDPLAFEEEFCDLLLQKTKAKFRHAGDAISVRIATVIPLAEKSNKEFAQKFRGLP